MSRTDFQRWLSQLPPFNQVVTQARTARRFTINDLAFFSLVGLLHRQLGLPLGDIAEFSFVLHEHVNRPSSLGTPAGRFFLNQFQKGTWTVDPEAKGTVSLSLDPELVWNAVYQFIGLALPTQRELAFGLVSVANPASREAVRGGR